MKILSQLFLGAILAMASQFAGAQGTQVYWCELESQCKNAGGTYQIKCTVGSHKKDCSDFQVGGKACLCDEKNADGRRVPGTIVRVPKEGTPAPTVSGYLTE